MNKKNLLIIQPGRNGDILLVLPIAKYYYDHGYNIIWPVCSEYFTLFYYTNFPINAIDIGPLESGKGAYDKAKSIFPFEYLDLAIGFGNTALDTEWKKTNLSFDVWKYNKANVPYFNKYNLPNIISRQTDIELDLFNFLHIKTNESYIVIHQNGSNKRHFDFKLNTNKRIIEIDSISSERWRIFDWLPILMNADQIYCVDSCFLNLVDQYNIKPPNGRYAHLWSEYYTEENLHFLSPLISSDWKFI